MNTFDHTVQATSGSAAAVDQVDAGRHRHQLARGQRDLGGVAAGRQQRAPLVAHRPAGHVGADRGDGAAALHAEHVGGTGRRRVEPHPLQQVGPVQPGGGDVEHHLAGSWLRVGAVHDGQDLGATTVVGDHSAHAGSYQR